MSLRFFNTGSEGEMPTTLVEGKPCVSLPPIFCRLDDKTGQPIRQLVPVTPGAVVLSLPGYGFYVVAKHAWWEAPHGLAEETVKALAPQLITEAEYQQTQTKQAEEKPPEKRRPAGG